MVDTAAPPLVRTTSRWWLPVVVLLLGAGGGVLTELLQGVLVDPWAAWANSVAAWCLLGAAAGALAGRLRVAVAAAVATELLLVLAYYGAQYAQLLPVSGVTAAGWLVAAVPAGVVFGAAGHWCRCGGPRPAVVGAALIAGVVVGEGVHRAVAFPWQGSSGAVMVVVGVVLAVALGRTWAQRAAVLGLLACAVPLALLGIRLVDAAFAAW